MKKTISVLLLLSMLFGLLQAMPLKAQAAFYSGTCGENVTWEFNTTTGVLSISGSGSIADYTHVDKAPWNSYTSNITSVVINNGVTSIGTRAFANCVQMTNVTLPDSMICIGDYAFNYCSRLKNLTIPNSVTSIGSYAFYYCYRLDNLTIPNSVISIGSSAFKSCSGLTGLTIPNSITSISDSAFYMCSGLTSLTIPDSVTIIGSSAFYCCSKLTSLTIPDSVISIGSSAFKSCSGLTSVTISDGVTDIGSSAFEWCENLTSVTIPDSVTSLGDSAFRNCEKMTSITLPSNLPSIGERTFYACKSLTDITIPNGVTSIGDYAFYDCDSLTNVTIPSGVTSIDEAAFYSCDDLKGVTIPNTVTSIGGGAFSWCRNLTSVTIPNSVTSIDASSFTYCRGLKEILVDEENMYYSNDASGVLFNKDKTTLIKYPAGVGNTYIIPNTVTHIGKSAFNYCYVKNITIPDSVTSIDDQAFDDCDALLSIALPKNVSSIGINAFRNCDSLTEIWVDEENECFTSDAVGILLNKDMTTLIRCPEGRSEAYVIPNTVTIIDSYAFSGCDELTSVTIPNGVTTIREYAFSGCDELTSVTIPNSVTSIEEYAFYDCYALTRVSLTDGLVSIGDHAFDHCGSITSIAIPNSVTSFGDGALFGCYSLIKVTFLNPNCSIRGEYRIGDAEITTICGYKNSTAQAYAEKYLYTFEELPDPTNGSCGENLAWLLDQDSGALTISGEGNMVNYTDASQTPWYTYRESITSVEIGNNVTSIGDYTFASCNNLESITTSNNVKKGASSVALRAASLKLPNSITSIGIYAFSDCTSLKNVILPNSVTSIGNNAFISCEGITSLTILNPTCIIYDSADTLGIAGTTVIYGYKNSTAQDYAEKYGYTFAAIEEPVPDGSLDFSMSITVGAEMQVVYTVLASKVSSYESFYLEVSKNVVGGEPVVTTYGLDEGMTEMQVLTNASGKVSGYRATYTGINAKEMGDEFTATLYAVAADGTIYYGNPNTKSIKSFLMGKITDTVSPATLKTLAVDMLNYGAAAQLNFSYDTENLVNADLTEEQKALGTQTAPEAVDSTVITGDGINLTASVTVKSKVELTLTCLYKTEDASNVKFIFKDKDGNVLAELAPTKHIAGKAVQCVYDQVGAKQMRELITIEVYDGDTLVSKTLTWSVESYVAATLARTTTSEILANMVNAMLIYGDSAAAYLA